MGVYYFYVNDTKKQYFCIDPSLSEIKRYALGRNIGSRALSYLILDVSEAVRNGASLSVSGVLLFSWLWLVVG